MDCIKVICLYLKGYILVEQFEKFFFDCIDDFQSSLGEDIYLDILSTNFSSKEEKISLETKLYDFVLKNYMSLYEKINDAYVEHMIQLNQKDTVVEMLKKKYEKREEVEINCSMIITQSELINVIKKVLQYPQFCGNNWNAIEDLIYDIILPQKLTFINWSEMEKRLPQDTTILKAILDRNSEGRCVITYA
ncbi:MAG: barstar family protein [Lachnospiraceae bacterium]|nr:barstar family protein [Lachnospiraceae bacterium]